VRCFDRAAQASHLRHLVLGLCVFTVACSGATPASPSASLAPVGQLSSSAQPHFNLEAILRGDGFGLVSLRQGKDPTQDILYMDVWVRDLLPNTSYDLQRAVDGPRDGVCTGTNWLTMGQGPTPQPILTDETGTGRAELWRPVPATATPGDIHFRVIRTGTSTVALQSDCYQLLLRD
jgi:hypothetical protein